MAAVARAVGRPVPVQEAGRRPGDPPELVADASEFRREFGWEPRHSDLDTIVSTAWKWLQSWKLGKRAIDPTRFENRDWCCGWGAGPAS